jgi:hypothetical protein
VADVAASLEKAYAEVDRLKEWQDIFKRMADDKAQEAAQELEACKARAADRQLAAAGEQGHGHLLDPQVPAAAQ